MWLDSHDMRRLMFLITCNPMFGCLRTNCSKMGLLNPQVNVLQALSLAGGTTPFAKLDNIIIIRGTGAAQTSLPFRYNQVTDGKSLAQNVVLEAGDVVVVP